MKKVRITVKKGLSGKKFLVFNSPESLYVWLNDPELKNSKDLDPTLGTVVHLREGEIMEVEWRGFETVYEKDGPSFYADLIRIGKDIKTNLKLPKQIVGIHEGWVTKEIIEFKSYSNNETRTTLLSGKSRHKFNLDELFEAESEDEIKDLEDAFEMIPKEKQNMIN